MRPERVAAHIVVVVGVALGSVAVAAPRVVVVVAAQAVEGVQRQGELSQNPRNMVHIAGALGKAVPVVGLAGGASARRAAAHDVAVSCLLDLTALAQLGLSLRVQLGERQAFTSRKTSHRPFTERWTLSVRLPGVTLLADSTARAWRGGEVLLNVLSCQLT